MYYLYGIIANAFLESKSIKMIINHLQSYEKNINGPKETEPIIIIALRTKDIELKPLTSLKV